MIDEALPPSRPLQEVVHPRLDGVFGMDAVKRRLLTGHPVLQHLVVGAVRLGRQEAGIYGGDEGGGGGGTVHLQLFGQDGGEAVAGHVLFALVPLQEAAPLARRLRLFAIFAAVLGGVRRRRWVAPAVQRPRAGRSLTLTFILTLCFHFFFFCLFVCFNSVTDFKMSHTLLQRPRVAALLGQRGRFRIVPS